MNVNVTVELEIILCQHHVTTGCFCLVHGFPLEFYFRGHKSPMTLIQGDILGDFRGQSYDT